MRVEHKTKKLSSATGERWESEGGVRYCAENDESSEMKWDRGRVPFLLLLLPLLAMVATAGTKASKGKEGRKSASIGTTNALTTPFATR